MNNNTLKRGLGDIPTELALDFSINFIEKGDSGFMCMSTSENNHFRQLIAGMCHWGSEDSSEEQGQANREGSCTNVCLS